MVCSLFPASGKSKYMMMLSAYMDETGHSRDERQLFNGMAGLLAPAENWIEFERQWNETLARREYKLPFFHMKEFVTRDYGGSKSRYTGWPEAKRQRLFGRLMRLIENLQPIPIGAIMHMPDWRGLTEAQREILQDPYLQTYQNVIAFATSFLEFAGAPPDVKVSMVFSDQVEFRRRALKLYEQISAVGRFIKRCAHPPDFRPMQDFPALQAADIVAYEMYKEYERVMYRPQYKPRYGYSQLAKMSLKHGLKPMFRFYSKAELTDYVKEAEQAQRTWEYWQKRRKVKDGS